MKNEMVKVGRPWYFIIVFLATLTPNILWVWPIVILTRLTLGQKLHGVDWGLWTEIKKRTWLANKLKYSGVTLGDGGIAKAGKLGKPGIVDTLLEYHEQRHVHQHQVMQVFASLITLYAYLICDANYWIFAVLPVGSMVAYLCAMLVAVLRGEEWYRGNIFERSAYAQTTVKRQSEEKSEIDRLARYLMLNLGGEIIEGGSVDITIECLNKWRRLSRAPELQGQYPKLKARTKPRGIGDE